MMRFTDGARGLALAGFISVALSCLPVQAFAAINQPSVGDQSTGGQTELTMVLQNTDEHAQSDENLAFTIPSAINYVVKADGTLIGPSAGAASIINKSAFAVHVSALQIRAEDPFAFVDSAMSSTQANAVDLAIGPASNQLSAASYVTKSAPSIPSEWNMSAAAIGSTDELALSTSGHVGNVTTDITTATKFGTIQWYVAPGSVDGTE